jgi:hypothetical protein
LISSTEKDGVKIFFFHDESNMRQRQQSEPPMEFEAEPKSLEYEDFYSGPIEEGVEAKPNAQVAKELGDPTSTPKGSPKKTKRKKVYTFLFSYPYPTN